MGDARRFGVVVVGVGIVGKVRIRDLKQAGDSDWKLVGFVSRRRQEVEGVQQLSEAEALSRPDVNAVIVCTEPAAHEDIIRKSLTTGRHVLVEYPMTTTAKTTRELYRLASEKGLVLHEENIALLTPGYTAVKKKLAADTVPLVRAEIKLVGNCNGWAENFEKSGGPFTVSVSMIQMFYEYFGDDIAAVAGTLEMMDKGFTATASLSSHKCSKLSLTVERSRLRQVRSMTCKFHYQDDRVEVENLGSPGPPPKPGEGRKIGLFMQDFLSFMSEIQKQRDNTKDIERTIRCMEIADDIHKFMGL